MATWWRNTNTYDIDGSSVENSAEELTGLMYVYSCDRDIRTADTFYIDNEKTYEWRQELRHMDGNGQIIYSGVTSRRMYRNQETDTLVLERSYDDSGNWTYLTEYGLELEDFLLGLVFNMPLSPGTKELWQIDSVDGVAGNEYLVGTFDVRDITAVGRSDKPVFNPLKEGVTLFLDFLAFPAPGESLLFPGGWTPSSIDWVIENAPFATTGSAVLQPVDSNGKVGTSTFQWNGKLGAEFAQTEMSFPVRFLAEVPGIGNFYKTSYLGCNPRCKKCRCLLNPDRGELEFSIEFPLQISPTGPPLTMRMSYQGGQFSLGPASMGYGWSSDSSERMAELPDDAVIYETPGGIVLRWEASGGGYVPATPDNYVKLERPGTPSYRLTFRDLSQKEFNANGRLTKDIDRHGNAVTYTYSGSDLVSKSDGKGRSIHYDYGTRTDGQQVAVAANSLSDPRRVEFEYYSNSHVDSPNRLHRIISPEGEITEFVYYPQGQIRKVIQVRPTLGDLETEYVYSFSGQLASETVNGEMRTSYWRGTRSSTSNTFDLTITDIDKQLVRKVEEYFDLNDNLTMRVENGTTAAS